MDTWYYFDGGERRGPVDAEELVRLISAGPDPRRVRIWREGMPDWQEAGNVPEIGSRLPPARPGAPSGPSVSSGPSGNTALGPSFFTDAEAIAQNYRRLVLLVGLQLLVGFLQAPSRQQRTPSVFLAVTSLILIFTVVAIAVTAYRLTRHLGSTVPILWAILMFVPCVNILGLLVLSSKAQTWCRQYGVKVGFLGPTKESIEELRRRVQTSHFD
jgi:hypothetical protein